MNESICVDIINKRAIFIGEKGEIFFSDKMYEIGEAENQDDLSSIYILPLEEQREIINTL